MTTPSTGVIGGVGPEPIVPSLPASDGHHPPGLGAAVDGQQAVPPYPHPVPQRQVSSTDFLPSGRGGHRRPPLSAGPRSEAGLQWGGPYYPSRLSVCGSVPPSVCPVRLIPCMWSRPPSVCGPVPLRYALIVWGWGVTTTLFTVCGSVCVGMFTCQHLNTYSDAYKPGPDPSLGVGSRISNEGEGTTTATGGGLRPEQRRRSGPAQVAGSLNAS